MAMNITFMTSLFWNIRLRPWGFKGSKAKYEKRKRKKGSSLLEMLHTKTGIGQLFCF